MNNTTDLFKAMAHPTRLRILCLLFDGEVCVCKIMEVLDLPQSTASRHLAILKNVGLVDGRREGPWVHYSLAKGRSAMTVQLLEVLEEHLPHTREGVKDRQALSDTLQKKNCA